MTKIAILGAGESGVGAAILAKQKQFDVFVSDFGEIQDKYKSVLNKYEIKWEEGQHSFDEILKASEIIKSPGISDSVAIAKQAIEKEIPIISEIEFAARYTDAFIIAITGSNGKTTTTLLTHHILKKSGLNVGLAGNIGKSFALQVAENDYDHYVLELSSFQLDNMYEFKANIAMILNITPDHLDRYDYKFENYLQSKFRIIQNMSNSDSIILNVDDESINKELLKRKIEATIYPFSTEKTLDTGGFLADNELTLKLKNKDFTMPYSELTIQGKHNAANSLAAGISAKLLNIRNESVRESLIDFEGVEHRMENFLKIRDIQFINDSKATNINSTWYALGSMKSPTILILGGIDKGNDYSILTELVEDNVKAIICLGKNNEKIIKAFKNTKPVFETKSMQEAVKHAYRIAEKGDNVLLSPACASFDLFNNYEDRGNQFKNEVRNL